MKAALLVCVMAATALAAPRYKRATKLDVRLGEQVRAAEHAWTAAEREQEPGRRAALWEQAAEAFGAVDGAAVDAKVKREAAYAAVLAWKNALASDPRVAPPPPDPPDAKPAPQPLPAREQKQLAAFDRYVAYLDPGDPEVPGLLFLKGRTYARYDQLDLAMPLFRTILEHHRTHEVAEYAANLLLDAHNRLGQYDKLRALADELAGDAAFMRAHAELANIVDVIRRQARRKDAERLEAAARAAKDPAQYVATGAAYLDIYNASPKDRNNDEVLYNAGVAFDQGHARAEAIRALELLRKDFPNSKLAPRALSRLAVIYRDTAMFDRAADKLEEYAKRYAGEKDAYDALSDAVYYRKGLGDRAKAIMNAQLFIKMYGAKQPREAADAMWALVSLHDGDPERQLEQLRAYIRHHGARYGAERLVAAHAKIGALLRKQSCKVGDGIDGLCVTANERAPRTCGTGTTRTLIPRPRDERLHKEALQAFAQAAKELGRGQAVDEGSARYYFAQAKLAAADAELEAYLALGLQRDLTFEADDVKTRTASMQRFAEWTRQTQKDGERLSQKYVEVIGIKDAASSITAAARLGTISHAYATALVTAELPRDLRTKDKKAVYCDALTVVAEPLEARAVDAFAVCLAKSTELGWFGDSSVQCERELVRLRPDEFPRLRELRSRPQAVAPIVVLEPPLR